MGGGEKGGVILGRGNNKSTSLHGELEAEGTQKEVSEKKGQGERVV